MQIILDDINKQCEKVGIGINEKKSTSIFCNRSRNLDLEPVLSIDRSKNLAVIESTKLLG